MLLTFGLAAPAQASSVQRVQRVDPFGSPYESYYLQYTAAPGEANDLEIRLDAGGVTLRDAGHALQATGCEQIDLSTARCAAADPLTVKLAEGDLLDGGSGDDTLDLGADDDDSLSVAGPTFIRAPDGRRDTARWGTGFDATSFRDPTDVVGGCDADTLEGGFTVAQRLSRASRSTLRLRTGCAEDACDGSTVRIVVTPRGRSRPRLTRPVTIDGGTLSLRLTTAGRRYLQRRSLVSIISLDTDDRIDARVRR